MILILQICYQYPSGANNVAGEWLYTMYLEICRMKKNKYSVKQVY